MKRAHKSAEWRRFYQRATAQGYEVITRIGDPVIIHKKETPFSPDTIQWVFFSRKGGGLTKKQELGIQILKGLGQKTLKFPPQD